MSCVTAILAQNSATAQADLHFIYNGKSPWQPGEVNPKKKKEYLFCDVIFLHSQKHTVSRNKWLKKSNAIKNVHKIRNILRIRLYSRSQIWFGVKFKNGENSPADLFIVFIIYLLVCLFIFPDKKWFSGILAGGRIKCWWINFEEGLTELLGSRFVPLRWITLTVLRRHSLVLGWVLQVLIFPQHFGGFLFRVVVLVGRCSCGEGKNDGESYGTFSSKLNWTNWI